MNRPGSSVIAMPVAQGWARGMLEGPRTHPPLRQPRVLVKLVAGIDYLVPCLDIGVIFFWCLESSCFSSATR